MKKIITWLILSVICTAAFALPRPSQIDDALASKNYTEARGMVAEVLRERPDSARAHLLNAYLLVHADHNRAAANTELQTAAGLDKRGDVKSSPLFGRVVAEIDAAPTRAVIAAPISFPDQQPVKDDFPWLAIFLVLSVAAIGIYLIIRRRAELDEIPSQSLAYKADPAQFSQAAATRTSTFAGTASSASASAPRASTVMHEHHYASSPAAAPQSMSAFGTVASVAGGVMAGSALSAALMSHNSSMDEYRARRRREVEEEDERHRRDSYAQSYSDPSSSFSSPVSTSSERSSFSSSSSGSDSWSSSSSDSSLSSDFGSSSSFDSGSSSSGSDW